MPTTEQDTVQQNAATIAADIQERLAVIRHEADVIEGLLDDLSGTLAYALTLPSEGRA